MPLKKVGDSYYGDKDDLPSFLEQYIMQSGHRLNALHTSPCSQCGRDEFELHFNEQVGVGRRICVACTRSDDAGDTGLREDIQVPMDQAACSCGNRIFTLCAAKGRDVESNQVRVFLAGRCVVCGVTAVYADWQQTSSYHTLTLAIEFSDSEFGTEQELERFFAVEKALDEFLTREGFGSGSGHEIGGGYFLSFFDGPDPDLLLQQITSYVRFRYRDLSGHARIGGRSGRVTL